MVQEASDEDWARKGNQRPNKRKGRKGIPTLKLKSGWGF